MVSQSDPGCLQKNQFKQSMIQLQNISKTFRQKKNSHKALDTINLTIEKGEIVGVIGSSGAGKSTLIRCVNLLEQPDSGSVVINGINLTLLKGKALAAQRKNIGMIFQHFNLLSSGTVFENVALPLKLEKTDKVIIRQRVNELLHLVGLENKAEEYPNNLSGGQKQRVAIARALANSPQILLCDEATSALDPVTTQSILQLLRDINRRLHITILLITHEMDVVRAICDRVAVLDHGKLVATGSLEELAGNGHPALSPFITTTQMTVPKQLTDTLQQEYTEGVFPLIEIELNGNIHFKKLLDTIQYEYQLPYNIIRADIEYTGKANFGKVLIHLKGSKEINERLIHHFNQSNITNFIRGYAA